ncbi:MAG: oligoribonuclease [Gammaproteobacteria bacterium]|jgi:oligoribonuclease|nr:oligoribonuclease [Gammaproteobacteria bacterium]MBT5202094.1 oligoribonuclease [Gammaproteobacteria bacterium]MBT5601169.1 oligoribonuclease [Gammaproteobacteria bacterium]MBT6246369.1 oligoribonuclease [Gammaproteobacteria bacterium]
MADYSENLVWIDLEMTGLDPEQDRIIEIATIITDSELNILAEGPSLVVHQVAEVMAGMDEWNVSHHTESGLVERVSNSTLSEAAAEAETLAFVEQYVEPGQSPLCGNTIGQDRRFLCRYMPDLEAYLHYRNIDVSTVKELAVRWRPAVTASVKKTAKHRALDDIRESIEELKVYRAEFFS